MSSDFPILLDELIIFVHLVKCLIPNPYYFVKKIKYTFPKMIVSQESLMFTLKFTYGGVVFVFSKVCQVPTLRPFQFTSLHSTRMFPVPSEVIKKGALTFLLVRPALLVSSFKLSRSSLP